MRQQLPLAQPAKERAAHETRHYALARNQLCAYAPRAVQESKWACAEGASPDDRECRIARMPRQRTLRFAPFHLSSKEICE